MMRAGARSANRTRIEDDQGIPEKARAAAEKLITRDKAIAVTGGHQCWAVLAGIEVAHRYHVRYLNTSGAADAIREKGYIEVFNSIFYNRLVAFGTGEAIKSLGAKGVIGFMRIPVTELVQAK